MGVLGVKMGKENESRLNWSPLFLIETKVKLYFDLEK